MPNYTFGKRGCDTHFEHNLYPLSSVLFAISSFYFKLFKGPLCTCTLNVLKIHGVRSPTALVVHISYIPGYFNLKISACQGNNFSSCSSCCREVSLLLIS
jgi:hypothetical protein